MSIRLIASVVIAALLMTGGAVSAAPVTEYGVQPIKEIAQETLTQAEAEAIALEHAGLTREEVTGLRSEYDVERGTPEWDVDFRSGDWEYDYEVNARTGSVIKGEKEYDPVKVKPAAPEKPATPKKPAETKTLTGEEAQAIAMKHAGLTAAEVTGLRSEYDVDRGISHWDIDFRSGDWEYDYEVNAKTGEVLKSEKEYDPVKPAPAVKEEKPAAKLTAEEAKAAALKHAGLTASQVKGLRAEYDVDDGVPEWEVEFYADGMEYDYEIHAETGKIRSWDKERDD